MAYVLRGTASFPAGPGELTRTLDIPAPSSFGASGAPVSYLSSVKTADPADVELFDLLGLPSIVGAIEARESYIGARRLLITYSMTGEDPVNIEFEFVWGTPGDDVELNYSGA